VQIGEFFLDTSKVAAPIRLPVGFGSVIHAPALGRIVVGGVAVEKAICDDLVDHFFPEVLGCKRRAKKEKKSECEKDESGAVAE
jgi:hypothetical protein